MTLKDAIAYVVSYASEHKNLGKLTKTKLNKILWFAEREYMKQTGERLISGFEYKRLNFGPVIRELNSSLKELALGGYIQIQIKGKENNYILNKEYENLKNVDNLHKLNGAIEYCLQKKARAVSDETHDDVWRNLKQGDVMPVELVLVEGLPDDEITESDLEWAKKVFAERGSV